MNARRRLVVRIRDGHWLAAAGFLLIVCLFGCRAGVGPNGDRTPQPGHTTVVTCPPQCPPPATNPTLHAAVPADASGFCHDGTYTTDRSDAGKEEQCQGHGGVAE